MRRDYLVTLGAQLSQAGISLVSLVVLARLLMPVDFGLVVLLTAAVTIGYIALAAGAQAAVLVTCARNPELRPRVGGAMLLLAVGALLVALPIAVASSDLLAGALSPHVTGTIVLITALRVVPTMYVGLVTAALTGAGRIGTAAILGVIGALLTLLVPLAALLSEDRLLGATAGALAANIATMAVAVVLSIRGLGLAIPVGRRMWSELWAIAAPLHVGTVAYWFMLRADVFILNAIVGGAEVGLYALAVTLTERVGLVTTPLYNATAWRISGTDPVVALRTSLLIARMMIAIGFGLCVLSLIAAPAIVDILAGPEYRAAAPLIPILVVGVALLPVWGALGLFLISHEQRVWFTTILQVVVACAAIAGYVGAISVAGMYGAAVVSTLAYATLAVAGLLAIKTRHAFRWAELLPTPMSLRSLGDRR